MTFPFAAVAEQSAEHAPLHSQQQQAEHSNSHGGKTKVEEVVGVESATSPRRQVTTKVKPHISILNLGTSVCLGVTKVSTSTNNGRGATIPTSTSDREENTSYTLCIQGGRIKINTSEVSMAPRLPPHFQSSAMIKEKRKHVMPPLIRLPLCKVSYGDLWSCVCILISILKVL